MSKDLIKILIVDDNLIDHQIYKRLLSANNSVDYEYSLQESGEEGLRAVQEFHPNCILLDYMIPDMDGLSFLKKLADNAERVTIPVVMLTGQGNEKVAVEAMKYGVSDYLVKDEISSNVLNQSVYSALEKDQLRKQLRENEIKLKLSEERYNLAIQSTNIAIWDWDIEKDEIYYSDNFKKIVGRVYEDRLTTFEFLKNRVHREEQDLFARAINNHLKLKYPFELQFRIQHEKGSYVWIRMSGQAIWSEDDVPVRMTGFIEDVTRRKEYEEKLKAAEEAMSVAKETAEKADRAKSSFLASMSHEIRTPLNGVIGMADLLSRTEVNQKQSRYLEVIKSSGKSLLDIINNILDFSKIESNKLDLEKLPFNLAQEVQNTLATFEGITKTKNLTLKLFIEGNVSDFVIGDPVRIKQVLYNLVSNAIKFTHEGKVVVTISQTNLSDNEALLEFEVEDTGIGIPENAIGILFQNFTQVDSSTTRKYGGTGLGLAICKRLLDLMGGDITVNSIEGKGSVFSFRIKVKVKHDEPVIDNRVEIGDVEYISFLRKNAQKYQCLVVEDNIGNQEVITEVLNLINATFEIVENGEDAVDAYLKERYDLVLMDIQMPVMDGLEATRQIRKISDSNNDPYIIALTANAFEEDVKRSIEAGMNIHVSKPITFNDLIKPMYDFVKTLI